MTPPTSMWLPQSTRLLPVPGIFIFLTALADFAVDRLTVDAGTSLYAVANARAPATFMNPAPCRSGLTLGWKRAVYSRMALMRFGVRFGLACSINATAPLTNGVAMLVPLRLKYGALTNGLPRTPPTSQLGVAANPA